RLSLRPTIFDRDGATFDPAEFSKPLHERGSPWARDRSGGRAQDSDGRQLWRLRARRERPRRRAAEQPDELAPLHRCNHSITSSALACNVSGTVRPSALAVLRLITSANLVVVTCAPD